MHTVTRKAFDGYTARRVKRGATSRDDGGPAHPRSRPPTPPRERPPRWPTSPRASRRRGSAFWCWMPTSARRTPTTSSTFRKGRASPTTSAIPGRCVSFEGLVRPTSVPGVRDHHRRHPAGPSGVALESDGTPAFWRRAEMADTAAIDSAPLLAASDVFDILPMVDTVLLVVRSGRLTDVAAHRVADLWGASVCRSADWCSSGHAGRRVDGYGGSYGSVGTATPRRSSSVVGLPAPPRRWGTHPLRPRCSRDPPPHRQRRGGLAARGSRTSPLTLSPQRDGLVARRHRSIPTCSLVDAPGPSVSPWPLPLVPALH